MRSYYRVMLGKKSIHAKECFAGGLVGADFGIRQNLTRKLPEEWRRFNQEFIPIYLKGHPDKTKVSAGLACGSLWVVSKGIEKGGTVLCPYGVGSYQAGEVSSDYFYQPDGMLPRRRSVNFGGLAESPADVSQALGNSTGSSTQQTRAPSIFWQSVRTRPNCWLRTREGSGERQPPGRSFVTWTTP